MAITLQAKQPDGTWAVRNAFVTENKQVVAGSLSAADLEAKARRMMAQWQATMPDGKQLRVHDSAKDPKPALRKSSDKAKLHHVYCDASGAAAVTPDFSDAQRTFAKFCRDYPGDAVTWDRVDDFDPELGAFGIERFMQCENRALRSDENIYGLASIQQSISENRL